MLKGKQQLSPMPCHMTTGTGSAVVVVVVVEVVVVPIVVSSEVAAKNKIDLVFNWQKHHVTIILMVLVS